MQICLLYSNYLNRGFCMLQPVIHELQGICKSRLSLGLWDVKSLKVFAFDSRPAMASHRVCLISCISADNFPPPNPYYSEVFERKLFLCELLLWLSLKCMFMTMKYNREVEKVLQKLLNIVKFAIMWLLTRNKGSVQSVGKRAQFDVLTIFKGMWSLISHQFRVR